MWRTPIFPRVTALFFPQPLCKDFTSFPRSFWKDFLTKRSHKNSFHIPQPLLIILKDGSQIKNRSEGLENVKKLSQGSDPNLTPSIPCKIEADVSDPGVCILPARLFGDIIRRLPEGPVTVVVDESYKVSIRGGYASFTISAENAEDYPELPDVSAGRSVRIPQLALKELISGTIFAVSDNQGRPIHTGVRFEVEEDSISAIAVDGFRLARRTFHPETPTDRILSFVVPAAGLKEVEKILTDSDEEASFTLGPRHILFEIGSATLVCRLLEGEFLDWRRVVPTDCPVKLCAHVSDLAASIERVGLIVSEKYKSPVRCVFSDQVLLLKTNTTIGAAEDRCAIAGDGKELEIGFNVRYLADALRAIPSEEVILELTNGLSPIILTPADKKYDYSYMVLPVRIKNS